MIKAKLACNTNIFVYDTRAISKFLDIRIGRYICCTSIDKNIGIVLDNWIHDLF